MPGSAQRKHRWRVDERWRVYQLADFGAALREPLRRNTGSRGGASLTQALGSFRSCLGGQHRLPSAVEDPAEQVRQDILAFLELALEEPGLAERYCLRRRATAAEFSSVDDDAVVPDGIGRDAVDFGEEFDHATR